MNSVYIEITDVCNLHCSFCPCGIKAAQSNVGTHSSRTFMPSELFEKCIAGAEEIGAENVFFHVLGEPTLHPGFGLYVKKLEKTPLKLTLTTNGTTIARASHLILPSEAVRQVNFSTHAYAELPADEAASRLQDVLDFCRIAIVARPDLYINLRLWNVGAEDAAPWNNYMLSHINETFGTDVNPGHFCSRHKSFNVTGRLYLHEDTRFEWPKLDERREARDERGAVLGERRETRDERGTVLDERRETRDERGAVLGERRETRDERGTVLDERRETVASNDRSQVVKGSCRALDTHVAILHDGRVVACCLDHSGQITLGNIQEQSLAEIIASPLAQNLREGFEKHELRHPFCQMCSYCKRFK